MTYLKYLFHLLINGISSEIAISFRWELEGFVDIKGDLFILDSHCQFSFLQINKSFLGGKEWSAKDDCISWSLSMSRTIKFARKMNFSTLTSISSIIPLE